MSTGEKEGFDRGSPLKQLVDALAAMAKATTVFSRRYFADALDPALK